jgi:ABC-type polysaccharide transport system permease subunit
MYGAQIAFRTYNPILGVTGSPWVGLRHFWRFLGSPLFPTLMGNTLGLNLYSLTAGFPMPIILALSLNYTRNLIFKKMVQTVSYIPHFISTVVMVSIVFQLLGTRFGVVNNAIGVLGGSSVDFMGVPGYFKSIYVWSGIWQNVGWGTIIYLAALSGIDPQLHEAAIMDGAGKIRRIVHIDIPSILPTATVLLILSFGSFMSTGFEKVLLMQNDLNLSASEVIDTYVYKVGLASMGSNFSYSSAIGLFQSLIGFSLILGVNAVAKRFSETALW